MEEHGVKSLLTDGSSVQFLSAVGAAAVVLCSTAIWWTWKRSAPRQRLLSAFDYASQTRVLPDGSRVASFLDGDKLKAYVFDDAQTLYQAVRRGIRVSANGPMLGYRQKQPDGTEPYVWISYKQGVERTINFAYGLIALGVRCGQSAYIGIQSKNRPEWLICEHAAYNSSSVVVPLYDSLGRDAITYILNRCALEIVVCENQDNALALMKCKAECATLKTIIVMSEFDAALFESSDAMGVRVLPFADVERLGRELEPKPRLQEPRPDDLCTICFTSGTTGTPKGVMLTHGNVISCATVFYNLHYSSIGYQDVLISYLPLAHMYERLMESIAVMFGGQIGYSRGDVRLLLDDIKTLRPTVIPVVPRVLNRIYDKVFTEVNQSIIKKFVFSLALAYKIRELKRGNDRNDSLVDRLIFKKIAAELGGRVRIMLTGSAPVAPEVLMFARATLGCIVLEGYGQTECVAACTGAVEGDMSTGHVGVPLLCAAIKLVDVPELGYFTRNEAGEICVRGPSVFRGYFDDDAETRAVLDADGWLHSGDIGRWNPCGTLSIVDRKKHIFKLQQGEYIAPEKIENVYERSRLVLQTFVHGESLKSCVVAIVVPEEEILIREVKERFGLTETSLEAVCEDARVKQLIFDDMRTMGRAEGLCSFEQVKDIFVSAERFSIENDLLTPTLKNKRPNIKKRYASELAGMYASLP